MKNLFFLILMMAYSYNLQAQSETLIDFRSPSSNCINCYNQELNYNKGQKFGISFGMVKPISSKFDITTNVGYSFWRYLVRYERYSGLATVGNYKESNHVFNFSIGERFHLVNFKSSSIYSGLILNFQLYTNHLRTHYRHRNIGLSLEPTVGWRKSTGKIGELFIAVGYDQHLTSYDQSVILKPGRVGLDFGFNVKLKNKKETVEQLD